MTMSMIITFNLNIGIINEYYIFSYTVLTFKRTSSRVFHFGTFLMLLQGSTKPSILQTGSNKLNLTALF